MYGSEIDIKLNWSTKRFTGSNQLINEINPVFYVNVYGSIDVITQ